MTDEKFKTALFAAGCFWGVEDEFSKLPGVVETTVGYSGGHTDDPTYEDVCSDATGHAETVRVTFDPSKTDYEALLDAFWKMHDPTTMNRQGPDVGTQYRSAVFWLDEAQRDAAEKKKAELDASGKFKKPIVTEIAKAGPFWRAEDYHQKYFEKHPGKKVC